MPLLCDQCSYLNVGVCSSDNITCRCFDNRQGLYCDSFSTTQTSVEDRSWTIIVAVVSAVAGLFLMISIVMCVFFCIKRRGTSPKASKPTRQTFTIPRVHIPTGALHGIEDDFNLDNTMDDSYVDAPESIASGVNTTYNATYREPENRPEADFGIFDALENRIKSSKGFIPRPQMQSMMGTFSSFPADDIRFGGPSELASIQSDTQDINDAELVTDMLDDMTKDDDMEDEFVEALNPNIVMPGSALQPEKKPSGWFSVS